MDKKEKESLYKELKQTLEERFSKQCLPIEDGDTPSTLMIIFSNSYETSALKIESVKRLFDTLGLNMVYVTSNKIFLSKKDLKFIITSLRLAN